MAKSDVMTASAVSISEIKHVVRTLRTNPMAEGDLPQDVEKYLQETYFANGWTLFSVHVIHSNKDTISNQYVLVR